MMINKRLIGTVSESKKYIAGNAAAQWCSLGANITMMGTITRLLEKLYHRTADTGDLVMVAVVALIAIGVRFLCTILASRERGDFCFQPLR